MIRLCQRSALYPYPYSFPCTTIKYINPFFSSFSFCVIFFIFFIFFFSSFCITSLYLHHFPLPFPFPFPFPSPLGSWVSHFTRRHDQYELWIQKGEPACLWLSGLHIPEAYLTALVQSTCRMRSWPLDKSTLYTVVTKHTSDKDLVRLESGETLSTHSASTDLI